MGAFHLIKAEALAELDRLGEAIIEVDKVRARVGLPSIVTGRDVSTRENLIAEIMRERACELGYEDSRFNDLVRRKMKDNFTNRLHGIRTLRMDGRRGTFPAETDYQDFWYVKFPITRDARQWWNPGVWSDRWYLSAFPINEINKGYGLIQNPGW
jgi:hypothetical protein